MLSIIENIKIERTLFKNSLKNGTPFGTLARQVQKLARLWHNGTLASKKENLARTVISGPYFSVFGLSTEIYGVNLRILSENRKIRTRNNSVFGHFLRSVGDPR